MTKIGRLGQVALQKERATMLAWGCPVRKLLRGRSKPPEEALDCVLHNGHQIQENCDKRTRGIVCPL